jgi:hypothetical protein
MCLALRSGSTFLQLLEGSTTDGLGGAAASNFCLGDGSAPATLPVEGLRNSTGLAVAVAVG